MADPERPDLAALRTEYQTLGLDEKDVDADPFAQFHKWFHQAVIAGEPDPNAMCLATVAGGAPAARMVLLKALDARGFTFYTNLESRKARDLEANARAALCFFWYGLARQVRVEGAVERVDDAEADAYFATRPRGSQLGAHASPQSREIADRATLERALGEAERRFAGVDVPRPRHWGGYRVVPDVIELWQGRPNRLHDRLEYRRSADGWTRRRLAP
jgi:pyridoxamine 5'-phosphate oxidase